MSAGWPYRCTGMMAAVRDVTAASTAAGSIVPLSSSTSANTGVAPAIRMASPENAADTGEVMTSSPGPMPSGAQGQRDRVRAVSDADRVARAGMLGELGFERRELGPEHEPAARDHAVDRLPHGAGVGARASATGTAPRVIERRLDVAGHVRSIVGERSGEDPPRAPPSAVQPVTRVNRDESE